MASIDLERLHCNNYVYNANVAAFKKPNDDMNLELDANSIDDTLTEWAFNTILIEFEQLYDDDHEDEPQLDAHNEDEPNVMHTMDMEEDEESSDESSSCLLDVELNAMHTMETKEDEDSSDESSSCELPPERECLLKQQTNEILRLQRINYVETSKRKHRHNKRKQLKELNKETVRHRLASISEIDTNQKDGEQTANIASEVADIAFDIDAVEEDKKKKRYAPILQDDEIDGREAKGLGSRVRSIQEHDQQQTKQQIIASITFGKEVTEEDKQYFISQLDKFDLWNVFSGHKWDVNTLDIPPFDIKIVWTETIEYLKLSRPVYLKFDRNTDDNTQEEDAPNEKEHYNGILLHLGTSKLLIHAIKDQNAMRNIEIDPTDPVNTYGIDPELQSVSCMRKNTKLRVLETPIKILEMTQCSYLTIEGNFALNDDNANNLNGIIGDEVYVDYDKDMRLEQKMKGILINPTTEADQISSNIVTHEYVTHQIEEELIKIETELHKLRAITADRNRGSIGISNQLSNARKCNLIDRPKLRGDTDNEDVAQMDRKTTDQIIADICSVNTNQLSNRSLVKDEEELIDKAQPPTNIITVAPPCANSVWLLTEQKMSAMNEDLVCYEYGTTCDNNLKYLEVNKSENHENIIAILLYCNIEDVAYNLRFKLRRIPHVQPFNEASQVDLENRANKTEMIRLALNYPFEHSIVASWDDMQKIWYCTLYTVPIIEDYASLDTNSRLEVLDGLNDKSGVQPCDYDLNVGQLQSIDCVSDVLSNSLVYSAESDLNDVTKIDHQLCKNLRSSNKCKNHNARNIESDDAQQLKALKQVNEKVMSSATAPSTDTCSSIISHIGCASNESELCILSSYYFGSHAINVLKEENANVMAQNKEHIEIELMIEEDTQLVANSLTEMNEIMMPSVTATSIDECTSVASRIGYPNSVRSALALGELENINNSMVVPLSQTLSDTNYDSLQSAAINDYKIQYLLDSHAINDRSVIERSGELIQTRTLQKVLMESFITCASGKGDKRNSLNGIIGDHVYADHDTDMRLQQKVNGIVINPTIEPVQISSNMITPEYWTHRIEKEFIRIEAELHDLRTTNADRHRGPNYMVFDGNYLVMFLDQLNHPIKLVENSINRSDVKRVRSLRVCQCICCIRRIIAEYKENEERTFRLIVWMESVEYLKLSRAIEKASDETNIDPNTLTEAEDTVEEYLGNKHQLWQIEVTNERHLFGVIYMKFTAQWRDMEWNDYCVTWLELSLKTSGRDLSSSIWNNLRIPSAQNAARNDIVYATICWKQCLSRNPIHCEVHSYLSNILWLHLYDENKGEIHLQRTISITVRITSQIYDKTRSQSEMLGSYETCVEHGNSELEYEASFDLNNEGTTSRVSNETIEIQGKRDSIHCNGVEANIVFEKVNQFIDSSIKQIKDYEQMISLDSSFLHIISSIYSTCRCNCGARSIGSLFRICGSEMLEVFMPICFFYNDENVQKEKLNVLIVNK
eukprot:778943_1